MTLTPDERKTLLTLARDSIRSGLKTGGPLSLSEIAILELPPPLQKEQASFVTLHLMENLKGCIGNLIPRYPLAKDVALNAFHAAFEDPRFPEVREEEFPKILISISVLSLPEPVSFQSEEDLLGKIRPGQDGLILKEGRNSGTFLPAVWEQLPHPELFLRGLKQKAGLPETYWSRTLEVLRYTTESFSEKK